MVKVGSTARAKALVEELWENRPGAISTQILQELAVNLRRKTKKPLDAKATRDVISDYLLKASTYARTRICEEPIPRVLMEPSDC